MTIMEQDELARTRITSEIERNFFVEAAAGSGKTSSLVDRMIAMVGAGIDVSKICAITFTKTAAKEFYYCFQTKLMKYSREETDETRRNRFAEALRNIDLCFMGTIDSFSDMLLHEHPLEAGKPSETTVCADSDAKQQYRAEYARIKCGEYGEELQRKYERFRSAQKNADDVFAKCIGIFTELREAEFVYSLPADMDVNTTFTTWKNKLVQLLNMLVENPEYVGSGKGIQNELKKYPKIISVLRDNWDPQIGAVLAAMKQTDHSSKKVTENLRLYHDKDRILTPDDLVPGLTDAFSTITDKKGNIQYYYLDLKTTDAYEKLKAVQYAATVDFLASAAAMHSRSLTTRPMPSARILVKNMRHSLPPIPRLSERLPVLRHRQEFIILMYKSETSGSNPRCFFIQFSEHPACYTGITKHMQYAKN